MDGLDDDWLNEQDDARSPLWRDIIKVVVVAPALMIILFLLVGFLRVVVFHND